MNVLQCNLGSPRIENKKIGKILLKQELKIKGIESQTIENSLNLLYKEYNEKEIAIASRQKKNFQFVRQAVPKKLWLD